jgi:hypothetical protein
MLQFIRIQRNDPGAKINPTTYGNWVLTNQNLDFLYGAEFGSHIATQRKFGPAPVEHRDGAVSALARSVNRSVCTAVSPTHGLFDYGERTGAFNAADFRGFMNCLTIEVDQPGTPSPCYGLDSRRIHNENDPLNLSIALLGFENRLHCRTKANAPRIGQ